MSKMQQIIHTEYILIVFMRTLCYVHRLDIEIKFHRFLASLIKVIRLRRRKICGIYFRKIITYRICESVAPFFSLLINRFQTIYSK
jgi:hypothetical protein